MTFTVEAYSRRDRVTRGRAEAHTPAAALTAARTLIEDAHEAGVLAPQARIIHGGRAVVADVDLAEIAEHRAALAARITTRTNTVNIA